MEKTAIIILEYNNSEDTINCVKSVLKYNSSDIKIIIVDNGSTNKKVLGTIRHELKFIFGDKYTEIHEGDSSVKPLPLLTFLISDTNDGYAKGNNKGLSLAYGDDSIENIMILNSDVIFIEDIIPSLINDLSSKNTAIVSPLLLKKDLSDIDRNCARKEKTLIDLLLIHCPFIYDPFKILSRKKLKIKPRTGIKEIQLPSGSCMMARKELFKRIGGFDENTFLYFEEDILWSKIKKLKLKNYIDTSLRCIHLGATSTKKQPSSFMLKTSFESMHYYAEKYLQASPFSMAVLNFSSKIILAKAKIYKLFKTSHNAFI